MTVKAAHRSCAGHPVASLSAPRLAICIFHPYSDLWEIQLNLHQHNSTYTFYCKKHHPIHECILYATTAS